MQELLTNQETIADVSNDLAFLPKLDSNSVIQNLKFKLGVGSLIDINKDQNPLATFESPPSYSNINSDSTDRLNALKKQNIIKGNAINTTDFVNQFTFIPEEPEIEENLQIQPFLENEISQTHQTQDTLNPNLPVIIESSELSLNQTSNVDYIAIPTETNSSQSSSYTNNISLDEATDEFNTKLNHPSSLINGLMGIISNNIVKFFRREKPPENIIMKNENEALIPVFDKQLISKNPSSVEQQIEKYRNS
jgi:hypothetical protein